MFGRRIDWRLVHQQELARVQAEIFGDIRARLIEVELRRGRSAGEAQATVGEVLMRMGILRPF